MRVEEIAATQDIPENYLRRLLIELKRGGLVASQKGPSGGYLLARPPARITMADVVEIIEGDYTPVECLEEAANSPCPRDQPARCATYGARSATSVNSILRSTTLETLASKRKAAHTFHI